jgi:hypothetical protein
MTSTKTTAQAEPKKYPCVFKLTDDCPVKAEFKLKPENLRPWCEICPIRHQEIKEVEAEVEEDQDQRSHKPSKPNSIKI